MKVDVVARLEVPRHGLRPDAREPDLPLRIVGFDEVDVERNLAVHAHRLHLGDLRGPRTFQHLCDIGVAGRQFGFERSYVS